jgi:glycosyltransferase involved in cell wall biosynthesis
VKVLSLTSSYPRFQGDATAPFIESITKHVAALGHEIHVVLPEQREWNRGVAEDGIHFHTYRYSPRRSWTPWGYSQSLEAGVKLHRSLYALAPIVFYSARRTCLALARRERYDLVHAHWLVPNGLIAMEVSKRLGLPLVVSLHGSDISVAERSKWMGTLARRCFARAAAVTAPSEDLLDRARELGATGILQLIPYGADVDALRADSHARQELRDRHSLSADDVVVLGLGRFVRWKGFEYLIDAIARARNVVPEIRLVFAGDGDLDRELRQRVKDRGLVKEVRFAGMVNRTDIPGYLAAADIVAVPSVHFQGYVDGLPNVALEAMAAGKPLVATRVGGLPQVVRDGENGFLVKERDDKALADAIVTLAHDSALRERMGESGRALIRNSLNWNAVGQSFVRVYEQASKRDSEISGGSVVASLVMRS